jgi:uncharacterized protein (DUF433 family)
MAAGEGFRSVNPDVLRGVYPASRAAALSGVPKSTIYYWASHDVYEPSLAREHPKLWTYFDVVALRIIYWLRSEKSGDAGRSTMTEVRQALASIQTLGESLGSPTLGVGVDRQGRVFLRSDDATWRPVGEEGAAAVLGEVLEPLSEFRDFEGLVGPDLRQPRPHLRIVPGKVGGEPHAAGTRITSQSVASLVGDGLGLAQVVKLFPDLSEQTVKECVELEEQLDRNLQAA